MTRARFRPVDIWADDDPAVSLLREGLALEPPREPDPVAPPPSVMAVARSEVMQLRELARKGDSLAASRLYDLLRRLRGHA